MFVSTGLITALPLVLFGFATARTPLTVLGMLHFLLPSMQFLIGYCGPHESISTVGVDVHCLVWAGAAFFPASDAGVFRDARSRAARSLSACVKFARSFVARAS
ncbi:hypothetical protein ACLQ26_15285 [Micromonospora sp. DT43]|uniref:hypothetical protein n=1 Tax=Micromonospora sp. DT43 TaxID=3393440 RepID=UPI003CED61C3